MFIYVLSEDWREAGERKQLFTVGHWKPDGVFEPESDHDIKENAADRCHYLNGGMPAYELEQITQAACMYRAQTG